MKDLGKLYLSFFLVSSSVSSICYFCPVALGNNGDKRAIRVTTGVEQIQGWEQSLVRTNPNLARWHWDPMYSYKQGYALIGPERQKISTQNYKNQHAKSTLVPQYRYPEAQDNRPKHIPFSSQALEEVSARYKQPEQIYAPVARPPASENVYGQLSNKNVKAVPIISSYGKQYARQENTALKYSSQNTSVYGRVLGGKSAAGAISKSKKYRHQ